MFGRPLNMVLTANESAYGVGLHPKMHSQSYFGGMKERVFSILWLRLFVFHFKVVLMYFVLI